jgi:uncharacterized protein involved in exopolysaccharide biosynthesis
MESLELSKFQRKLVRRITSPMEVFYAVTAHWFLIFFFMLIGLLSLLVMVGQEPPLYSASMTLILKQPQKLMQVKLGPTPIGDEANFINEEQRILISESVVRETVQYLGYHKTALLNAQDDVNRAEGSSGFLLRAVESGREFLSALLPDEATDEMSEEVGLKRAVEAFSRRSSVLTARGSNHIKLRVIGPDRKQLVEELNAWLGAYRAVSRRVVAERTAAYLDHRIRFWKEEVEAARKRLEDFMTKHPEATKEKLDSLEETVTRQQSVLERLTLRLDDALSKASSGQPVDLTTPESLDEELAAEMRQKLKALELERVEIISRYGELSYEFDRHNDKIKKFKAQIQELESSSFQKDPTDPGGKGLEVALDNFRKLVEREVEKLDEYRGRKAAIENQVEQAREIQDEIKSCVTRLEDFQRDQLLAKESEEASRVGIGVLDEPTADAQALPSRKRLKIAGGAAGGIAAGIVVAFILELLSRRVRFKKDVTNDHDLDVVGVLLER